MLSLTTLNALLLAALPLTSAHFLLQWPPARGFNDDTAANFPCGGFDSASTNRTAYPLSGAPIQLDMHHTEANVQVLLAVGNDPGSAYNIVLRPTFRERGPNDFCMSDVSIPASANLTAGMNATIQVVTNGDPSGGLYQCADITITDQMLSTDEVSQHCTNSSGVATQALEGSAVNANQSTSGSSSGTASSSAASATASTGAAAANTWSGAYAVGVAAVGGAAVLLL